MLQATNDKFKDVLVENRTETVMKIKNFVLLKTPQSTDLNKKSLTLKNAKNQTINLLHEQKFNIYV